MRIIKLADKETIKVLNENTKINLDQEEIIKGLREVEIKSKRLEERFNKNMALSERIMERARPMVNKIIAKESLGEFEFIKKVTQDKKNKTWIIEIGDALEDFKHDWKHRNDVKKEDKVEDKKNA